MNVEDAAKIIRDLATSQIVTVIGDLHQSMPPKDFCRAMADLLEFIDSRTIKFQNPVRGIG